MCCRVLQCATTNCTTCVGSAVCCSVLQCAIINIGGKVCCSVLQCAITNIGSELCYSDLKCAITNQVQYRRGLKQSSSHSSFVDHAENKLTNIDSNPAVSSWWVTADRLLKATAKRDTLSEAVVSLRTLVTFVTWLNSRTEFSSSELVL